MNRTDQEPDSAPVHIESRPIMRDDLEHTEGPAQKGAGAVKTDAAKQEKKESSWNSTKEERQEAVELACVRNKKTLGYSLTYRDCCYNSYEPSPPGNKLP